MKFTDDGTDERNTLEHRFVCFLKLNFDMLIYQAPGKAGLTLQKG